MLKLLVLVFVLAILAGCETDGVARWSPTGVEVGVEFRPEPE